ncbi:MAG: EAL domain-containing protein [Bdellovibrio bacteriovorus]
MSAPTQAATVLVVSSQANEAERLVTSLRNGGLAVRGLHSAEGERIHRLVERGECDLVICCGYDPEVDLASVLARHRELGTEVPLLLVADHQSDSQSMIRALRAGARDVIERDDQEHLQLVVARELRDLRERRRARELEQRLQRCEQRSRELVESTGEAVAFVQEGLHLHANPAYLGLLGFPSLDDLQSATFLDLIASEQRRPVRDFLRQREIGNLQDTSELATLCMRTDGSRFPALLSAVRSESEGEPCLRIVLREADSAHPPGLHEQSSGSAGHLDGYQGLVAALDARIGPDGTVEQPFAVLVLRAPGAAELLQTLGLRRGLGSLDSLGQSLKAIAPETAAVYRISGDSFALVANVADVASATALEQRIRARVHLTPPPGTDVRARLDCDLGLVFAAGASESPVELVDEAYRLSLGGAPAASPPPSGPTRSTSLATRDKQAPEDGDEAMSAKIQQALDSDRFLLVYQPIVSLLGDNQENYSVLVRLIDETESLVEARDFIGPAIRHGLIERIDKWAIHQATRAIGEHRSAGHALNFFINLAEDSFRDPGLIIWICDCLREFDVRGSWLTFVFQEELVEANLASLTRLIEGLRKIKCRVAINRFGAGDHPETLLQAIPLDFVLFQPEYAQGLADDRDKQQKLLGLANLAREYNVKSVVTGVEEARTLTILWTAGVDYVQGNFLQRPSPTLEIST